MDSQLYTIEPDSPTVHSSVLPNISTSRVFSRPYTHLPAFLSTSTNSSPPPPQPILTSAPTPTTNSDESGKRIPRPPNPFMLFRSAFLKESRIPAHVETRQQHLSKVIGECWNLLTPSERAIWEAKADEAKLAHRARYPGYKYTPVRKAGAAGAPRRVSAAAKARDEKVEKEREEATRRLREEFTPYKGESALSQRNKKRLARSVRGTERAARVPRKAAARTLAPTSTSTSTSTPSTTTSSTSSTSFTTTTTPPDAAPPSPSISHSHSHSTPPPAESTLFAPHPIRVAAFHLPTPFVPSATLLTPTPSAGPQITRITQSPPLTPFHPRDRQPQLQLQLQHIHVQDGNVQPIQLPLLSFPLREPSVVPVMPVNAARWGDFGMETGMEERFDAFDAFGRIDVSVSQGAVYPAMGMGASYASAYFNVPRSGTEQLSDTDHACASMNATTGMQQYLSFEDAGIDYSAFTDHYTGSAYDAPTPALSPSTSSSLSPSSSSTLSPSSSSTFSPASGSPASLAYPDSPVTLASGSGFGSGPLDSPVALVYPFPSPDPAAEGFRGFDLASAAATAPYACASADPYPSMEYEYGYSYNYNYSPTENQNQNQSLLIKFDATDDQDQLLHQSEYVDALQRRYSGGSEVSSGEEEEVGGAAFDDGPHDAYSPWARDLGCTGLEVEFGRMTYF